MEGSDKVNRLKAQGARWLPYGILVAGVLCGLLLGKGVAIFVADRILYNIPILGGAARSVELAELINILLFSILGMALGIGVRWIPAPRPERFSRSILFVCIPILFLSSAFFQYQLWLSAVQKDMGISASEVRVVTNQWLKQTVHQQGLIGFYTYTAYYSVLPTTPQLFQASMQGSQRVDQLFSKVFATPPGVTDHLLAFCVWLLRLFYLSLSVLAALYHFQSGTAHPQPRSLLKLKPPQIRRSRKAYKKLK